MPLPEPREDEGKQDFIDRCLANDNVQKEFDSDNQQYAFCANTYEESKK